VANIFDIVGKYVHTKFPHSTLINSSITRKDGNPCSRDAWGFLTITNKLNRKYLVVSYWDKAEELFYEGCGWELKKCKGIYTSHGVFPLAYENSIKYNIPIIPITFCQYNKLYDELALQSKPVSAKENTGLLFRGWLHGCGFRNELGKLLPDIVKDQENKLPPVSYFQELQTYKINLSLDGAAELSHRDLEILGARSVLLRANLNQKFKNPLIPGVHYIGFERAKNAKDQAKIIMDKYKEIKDNADLLTTVSENGYKWFLENGTIEQNAKIIISQLDISKIL
jgi:hypothetical protein